MDLPNPPPDARILIAGGHPLFLEGLETVLDIPGIHVAWRVNTEWEALQTVRDRHPDLMILDDCLPDLDGLEVLEIISHMDFRTRVLLLTSEENPTRQRRAAELGAAGLLSKEAGKEKFTDTVLRILGGERVFPSGGGMVERGKLGRLALVSDDFRDRSGSLTIRERDVLSHLPGGKKTDEIAKELGIAPETVRTHIKHLYRKIRVHNRTQAVAWAFKHGIAKI